MREDKTDGTGESEGKTTEGDGMRGKRGVAALLAVTDLYDPKAEKDRLTDDFYTSVHAGEWEDLVRGLAWGVYGDQPAGTVLIWVQGPSDSLGDEVGGDTPLSDALCHLCGDVSVYVSPASTMTEEEYRSKADRLTSTLTDAGVETLYDIRRITQIPAGVDPLDMNLGDAMAAGNRNYEWVVAGHTDIEGYE